jgi:hypothetical protein
VSMGARAPASSNMSSKISVISFVLFRVGVDEQLFCP